MKSKKNILFPKYVQLMELVGENIKLARLRRKFSLREIASRSKISRPTLNKIEKGDSSVSTGAYFKVLKSLNLSDDLLKVARDDELKEKLSFLKKKELKVPYIPKKKILVRLGMNIKLARKRRGMTMAQVADGANINRETLSRLEKGDSSVSIGACFNVLRGLNLHKDILKIANEDKLGLKLRDLELLK
jgi:transcriptional regulator with XRE-family HTH domain